MVNVCVQYGRHWDILFNPSKSELITFGSSCPTTTTFRITLDNVEVKKVGKLKYLGCYFYERTCGIDFSYGFRKFYGNFNVMSVVGYYSNEMATLHLIKSYCVPSVLYGCETWYFDRHDYHRLKYSSVVGEKISLISCFIATLFQCHTWLTYVRFYFGRR